MIGQRPGLISVVTDQWASTDPADLPCSPAIENLEHGLEDGARILPGPGGAPSDDDGLLWEVPTRPFGCDEGNVQSWITADIDAGKGEDAQPGVALPRIAHEEDIGGRERAESLCGDLGESALMWRFDEAGRVEI